MKYKFIVSPKINVLDVFYLMLLTGVFFAFTIAVFTIFGFTGLSFSDWQESLLLLAETLIFLGIFLRELSRLVLHRLFVTEQWLIDSPGFPFGSRSIALNTINDCHIRIDLIAWRSLKILVLVGKKGETVGEINVNKFPVSDTEKLVSILRDAHSLVKRQRPATLD